VDGGGFLQLQESLKVWPGRDGDHPVATRQPTIDEDAPRPDTSANILPFRRWWRLSEAVLLRIVSQTWGSWCPWTKRRVGARHTYAKRVQNRVREPPRFFLVYHQCRQLLDEGLEMEEMIVVRFREPRIVRCFTTVAETGLSAGGSVRLVGQVVSTLFAKCTQETF
jgi:hypothetical protein